MYEYIVSHGLWDMDTILGTYDSYRELLGEPHALDVGDKTYY